MNAICPGADRDELIESVIRTRAAATGTSFEEMSKEYVRATALKRLVPTRGGCRVGCLPLFG